MVNINYLCSTVYVKKLNITLIVSAGNERLQQHTVFCSAGSLNISNIQCGQITYLERYWIFTNGSAFVECPLSNDTMSLRIPCPTTPPRSNRSRLDMVKFILE